MIKVSKPQARRIAVEASFASESKRGGSDATLAIVEHLGYVQIDTISVIERAHHHVFWARQGNYESANVDHLLSKERSVFEHWAHAVAYLPMKDYRYFRPKIGAYRKPTSKWQKERYATARPLFKQVLERIDIEGPLGSKDFEHKRKRNGQGWWDWKPAKVALEYLYLQGDLMVASRRNFQRRYDLTERVLPADLDLSTPSPETRAEHQIKGALQSMGLARELDINKYLQVTDRKSIKVVLKELVQQGDILELCIKGSERDVFYAKPATLETHEKKRTSGKKMRILSPFDNLIIQRDWMRQVFDFDYTIECYVPASKRKYGYFVCPVLWGNDIVARVDMKADRKAGKLNVNGLYLEASLKHRAAFDKAFENTISEFARFNGCVI